VSSVPSRRINCPLLLRHYHHRPGIDAVTAGFTGTRVPIRTKTRWLGANRDASLPSLISRVSAKRSNAVAGRYSRLFGNPSTYHRQSPPGTRSPRHDSGPHAQLFPHTRRSAINRIAASSEGRLMHIVAPTNALRFYSYARKPAKRQHRWPLSRSPWKASAARPGRLPAQNPP
jgi:hypothetical protein